MSLLFTRTVPPDSFLPGLARRPPASPHPAQGLLLQLQDDKVAGGRAAVAALGVHEAEEGFPGHLLCHHGDSGGDRAEGRWVWGEPAGSPRPVSPLTVQMETKARRQGSPGRVHSGGRALGHPDGEGISGIRNCANRCPVGKWQVLREDSKTTLAEVWSGGEGLMGS